MSVGENDIITLSDNVKYLVVSKVTYEKCEYFCLVDINNYNIKYVTINKDTLIEVKDQDLLDKIMLFMIKDLKL